MSELPTQVMEFLVAIGETPEAWKSIDVRTVAVRPQGVLENLYTLIRLSPKHLPEASEVLATTASLLALRQTFGIESLRAILEKVHAGTLSVAGEEIKAIKVMEPGRVGECYGASSPTLGNPLRDLPVDAEFRIGHSLYLHRNGLNQLLLHLPGGEERLSRELRAAAEPWDGLRSLLRWGLQLGREREPGADGTISVVAPLAARLRPERCALEAGVLSAVAEIAELALAPLTTIGYICTTREEPGRRGSARVTETGASAGVGQAGSPASGAYLAHADSGVGEADHAAIFLRVGPYVVDRADITNMDRHPRTSLLKAYACIDPGLDLLSRWLLAPKQAEQVEFERAVGRVFALAGFSVDTFAGDKRLSDAPDIIATLDVAKLLLVIECTTGPLQSREGKLSRLVARTQLIREGFRDGDGPQIVAVIATPLEGSTLSATDRAAASQDGITVLDNQALSILLAVARTGKGPGPVVSLLKERSTGDETLSQLNRFMYGAQRVF